MLFTIFLRERILLRDWIFFLSVSTKRTLSCILMEKSLWRVSSGLPEKDSQRERWIFCQLSLRESFWFSQEDNLSRLSPLIPQEKAPSQRGTLCPRLSKEILPCFFQKGVSAPKTSPKSGELPKVLSYLFSRKDLSRVLQSFLETFLGEKWIFCHSSPRKVSASTLKNSREVRFRECRHERTFFHREPVCVYTRKESKRAWTIGFSLSLGPC